MTADAWKQPLVRFRNGERTVGTGVLTAGGLVLTCAHVIQSLPREAGMLPGPGTEVSLDLPFAGMSDVKAVVADNGWHPKLPLVGNPQNGRPSDVAVLELCAPGKVDGMPYCLVAESDPQVGTDFSAWGFPQGYVDGALSCGKLRGCDSAGRLDVVADDVIGHFFNPGFSGAPLFAGRDADVAGRFILGLGVTEDAAGKRIARAVPPVQIAHALRGVISPYRWLRPFTATDADFFFGRGRLADTLWRKLREDRTLLLAGPPGTGKSSFLRAGLGSRALASGYSVRIIRPMTDPWAELATAFGLSPDTRRDELARTIRAQAKQRALLLGIDQAEELTRGSGANEAASFLLFLSQLLAGPERLMLALAARVDALGALFTVQPRPGGPDGPGLLEQHLRNLDAMGDEELRAAIKLPARRLRVEFEDGLAERIVQDALLTQAPLPIVQFCLSRLWESRCDTLISLDSYLENGAMTGVFAKHASSVLGGIPTRLESRFPGASWLGDDVTALVRHLLLQFVEVGASPAEDRRRRVSAAEVPRLSGHTAPEIPRMICEVLEEGRLIVSTPVTGTAGFLELVHDSLLTEWAELRGWIDNDRDFHLWRTRIRTGLAASVAAGHTDEASLLRAGALAQAQEWLAKKRPDFSGEEIDFIEASLALAAREAAARQAAEIAEVNLQQQLAFSQSLRLAVRARSLAARSPETALLLAGEAVRYDHNMFTDEALREASDAIPAEAVCLGTDIVHATFLPDGGILTLSGSGMVRRMSEDGTETNHFKTTCMQAVCGSTSPDGTKLLAISMDGTGHLADTEDGSRTLLEAWSELSHHAQPAIHWSPDGTFVLVADGATAWIWDLATREVSAPWDLRGVFLSILHHGGRPFEPSPDKLPKLEELRALGHVDRIVLAVLSPDGTRVATASSDGTIRVWNKEDGQQLWTAGGKRTLSLTTALAFLPTGLVSGHLDMKPRLWNENGDLVAELDEDVGDVGTIAVHPGSDSLITASDSFYGPCPLNLWTLDGTRRRALDGHKEAVKTAVFSSDGELIASGSEDKTVRIWSADGTCLAVLQGHTQRVLQVAFGPAGDRILSRSYDGEVRLWRWGSKPHHIIASTSERQIAATASYWGTDDDLIVFPTFEHKTYVVARADGRIHREMPGMSAETIGAKQTGLIGDRLYTLEKSPDRIHSAFHGPDGVITEGPPIDIPPSDAHDPIESFLPSPQGDKVLVLRTRTAVLLSVSDGEARSLGIRNLNPREGLVLSYAMFSPCGRYIAIGSRNGSLWVLHSSGELLAERLIDGSGSVDNLYSVAISPDGSKIVATIREQAELWDISLRQQTILRCDAWKIRRGLFSPDGSRILTAANDGRPDLRLWNGDGQFIADIPFDGNADQVAFGPAGSRLLAWPSGRTLHVRDLDGRPVACLRTDLDEPIRIFAFDATATRVAIGSAGCEIQVWSIDGEGGIQLATLKGHASEINSLQFSRSGKRLLTSSSDGTVREFILDLEELVADAAARIPRALTDEEIDRYAVPRPLRFGPARVRRGRE